ncbi:hypothetical protein [Nostoc sp. UIC 10630]|uniref:hypothetical protein n=1 Tax=Nostoc sp. UIC 10630 TaxID=2100146 RepID=UPI001FB11200|nr:hypothetical protein [Nostoc sp. UIC 10630]
MRLLLDAAAYRKARYSHRDNYTLMLMMFRHGLRVGKTVNLYVLQSFTFYLVVNH